MSIHSGFLCLARDGTSVHHVQCNTSSLGNLLLEYKEIEDNDLHLFEKLQVLRYSNGSDIDGGCPLHSSVDISLLNSFPVDCSDAIGRTPLMSATVRGSPNDVEMLLQYQANCSSADITGVTAVWLSAAYHRFTILKILLSFPQCLPSISRGRMDGVTPLIAASSKHITDNNSIGNTIRAAIVRVLFASHVIDAADIDGVTAVIACAEANDTLSVSALLAAGANPNAMTSTGFTALMFAAAAGSLPMTRELLQHRAEPDQRPPEGPTALMYASAAGHCDIVKALLLARADVTLVHIDSNGSSTSALREAAANNHSCVVEQLLASAHEYYSKNNTELRSAFLAAVKGGHTEIVRYIHVELLFVIFQDAIRWTHR